MRLTLCAFATFQEHITYLLTAIMASFGKIFWVQEEPKSLPSDAFPGLQICQNCLQQEGRGGGREEKRRKGREKLRPLLKSLDPPLAFV